MHTSYAPDVTAIPPRNDHVSLHIDEQQTRYHRGKQQSASATVCATVLMCVVCLNAFKEGLKQTGALYEKHTRRSSCWLAVFCFYASMRSPKSPSHTPSHSGKIIIIWKLTNLHNLGGFVTPICKKKKKREQKKKNPKVHEKKQKRGKVHRHTPHTDRNTHQHTHTHHIRGTPLRAIYACFLHIRAYGREGSVYSHITHGVVFAFAVLLCEPRVFDCIINTNRDGSVWFVREVVA